MSSPAPDFNLDQARFPAQREFALAADPEAVGAAVDAMMAFMDASGISLQKQAEIALAVTEAVVNAVVHGSGADRGKTVRCIVGCDASGGVLIAVRDSGPGYDPASIADPLSREGLQRDHGRGLHLIRQLMDEVTFAHNGAEIRMWKK
ncbi:MAG TPA: ATP-binding protein [Terriglobales bacterium]|jgi:serine/threonine-protein kinase RsbW|nr:ATP-binding protein [Terriglobales bacterium]